MDMNLRDFSDRIHKKLKVIATIRGLSLKDLMMEYAEQGIKQHIKSNSSIKDALEKIDGE